ncbi:hypothetical protein N2152v2_004916 [Parachlorella kessleri]
MLEGLSTVLLDKPAKTAERARRKVVNQRDSQDRTALMLACQAGAVGCVRLLLAAGADPILLDGLQNSCLHHAARCGASDVLELLLGDSTWVKTANGDRVLLRRASVIDHRHRPVRVVDGQSSEVLSPLHLAALRGHMAAVRVLVRRGAKLSADCTVFSDDEGSWPPFSTPLHLAAANGHSEVALTLLRGWARQPPQARGPDLRSLQDFRGSIAADVARAQGHTNLFHILNPDTPLDQALSPPAACIPSLVSIAAEVLRGRLLAQLEVLGLRAVRDPKQPVDTGSQQGRNQQQQQQQQRQGEHTEQGAEETLVGAGHGSSHAQQAAGPGASSARGASGALLGQDAAPESPGATELASDFTVLAVGSSPDAHDCGQAIQELLGALEGRAASASLWEGPQLQQANDGGNGIQPSSTPSAASPSQAASWLAHPVRLSPSASPACGVCLGRDSGSRLSVSSAHSGGDGSAHSQGSAATCPICYDRWARPRLVQAAWCGHRVCLGCARSLCERCRQGREVRCPLCRSIVGNWVAARPFGETGAFEAVAA